MGDFWAPLVSYIRLDFTSLPFSPSFKQGVNHQISLIRIKVEFLPPLQAIRVIPRSCANQKANFRNNLFQSLNKLNFRNKFYEATEIIYFES